MTLQAALVISSTLIKEDEALFISGVYWFVSNTPPGTYKKECRPAGKPGNTLYLCIPALIKQEIRQPQVKQGGEIVVIDLCQNLNPFQAVQQCAAVQMQSFCRFGDYDRRADLVFQST